MERKVDVVMNEQILSACALGDLEAVKSLSTPANITSFENSGTGLLPLAVACSCGHFHVADYLLSIGADFSYLLGERRKNSLTQLIEKGPIEAIYYIAKHSPDIVRSGRALATAIKLGNFRKTKALLEMNADPNVSEGCLPPSSTGDSCYNTALPEGKELYTPPIFIAIARHFEGILQLLIDHGAKVDVTNYFGCTPLNFAFSNGCPRSSTVRILCEAGADPEERLPNEGNDTMLLCSVHHGRCENIRIFLEYNCNPNEDIKDTSSWNFLTFLEKRPNTCRPPYFPIYAVSIALMREDAESLFLLYQAGCPTGALWEYHWQVTMETFPAKLGKLCELIMAQPHLLQELCRFKIRRLIGWKCFKEKVDNLPVPNALRLYIKNICFNHKDYKTDLLP